MEYKMKWEATKEGDMRTIYKFLFLPRKIGGEARWLEGAKILQRYSEGTWAGGEGWKDIEWVAFKRHR